MKAGSNVANERQHAQAQALQHASSALQRGQPIDAERIAGDILKASPGHPEATKVLAYALMMQERAKEAVAPLERVARTGHNPEIETQLAIALRRCGQSDKALIWLRRAVKRTPPFPAAFHELGYLLNLLRQPDEAVEVLQQGVALAPMMPEMWSQLGYVCRAMRDHAGAIEAFSRALAINPVHPHAVEGITSVLMHDGDYARAAEFFKRVISASPEQAWARVGLGTCLLELGESDAAYACLRAGLSKGAPFEGALKAIMASSRGRFWLRPSSAAAFLKNEGA